MHFGEPRRRAKRLGVRVSSGDLCRRQKHPKFEVYLDKAGEFRFRLKARNGEIVATSEGYKAKASCLNGIESVKKNAPDAEVVEEE